jgi:hypothetical protein
MLRALKLHLTLTPDKYMNVDVVAALRLSDVSDPADKAVREHTGDSAQDRGRF